jgi:cytosol alanyl aminopeptidase
MLAAFLLASSAAVHSPAPADPVPPGLRLGDAARPTLYTAELRIVPTEEPFHGTIDIEIVATRSLPSLWLNAEELEITEAFAEAAGARYEARVITAPKDFLGFVFTKPLPAGPARLHVAYNGKLSSRDARGAGRVKEGDDWYVATQFESLDARRVFPCFDEPSFKAPWRLTLVVKKTDSAFANAPEAGVEDTADGFKKVRFAESKPLPTYAVAFAVGPYEALDAGRSPSGTPLRVLVPRGQADRAAVSVASAAPILAWFESYFGLPYPYEKLDNLAVPLKGGAMENPGLITFGTQFLLRRPGEETLAWRRGNASITAHEFAHLWFGDLVTMAWWDDLWLNEAFATWLASKMVGEWKPEWGFAENGVLARDGAMTADSLAASRKVRQPIETADDIHNAFDGITYAKGGRLLAMFERWVGADTFRKGVQRYLKAHPHGNATAADFLSAVSAEAGTDIAPAFSSFLDQAGVPLIQMDLACETKRPPVLKMRQERYRPVGSEIETAAVWQVPVCVRWGGSGQEGRACTLLGGREGTLPLEGASACPEWLVPNEDGAGYYRSQLTGDGLERLLASEVPSVKERIALVGDLAALVYAGRVPYARALAVVPDLARHPSRHVVQAALALAGRVRTLVPPALAPAHSRWIRDTYGARARELGWHPRPDDGEETRALRVSLLGLVAGVGEDPELAGEAGLLADAWLRDRRAVDPEMVDVVLRTAARYGDAALFEVWRKAALEEKDRNERRRLLAALGGFRDEGIARSALALILSADFDIRETFGIAWQLSASRETRTLAYDFVKTNFDTLVARLPRDGASGFASFGASLCEESAVGELESFFKERTARFRGGPRRYAQALESLKLCIALREAQGSSAAGALSRYGAGSDRRFQSR